MQSTSQIAWGIAIVLLVVYAIWWWQQRRKFRARQRAVQPQALSGAPTESAKPKPVPTVAIGVVRKRYEQQARTCAAEQQNCSLKLRELSAIDYNTWEPTELLKRANAEETANLVAILGLKPSDRDKDLVAELRSAGSHSIATLFRGGTPVPYAEVVTDVAKKLKVPDLTSDTLVAEVERQVVETLINMRLAKAEPEEREQMLRALGVARDGTGQALTMAAGGLVVANLSGFALYTAASSALAGVAGLFGVVLLLISTQK